MKLFLVRHGETEENVAGISMGHLPGVLTEKGKEQAKETAEALKGREFAHIYCSDLARCIDTVEFIAEFHPDTPLTITQELRERNLGDLQGQITKSIDWEKLPGEGYDKRPPNGESVTELRARALDFVRQLYGLHPEESVLLVTHTGWIANIISQFTGKSSKELLGTIGHAQIFEVEIDENLTGKVLNL